MKESETMRDIEKIKKNLREDESFREKFHGVRSLDEAVSLSREMGFEVDKGEIENDEELSENFLESVAGGKGKGKVQRAGVVVYVGGEGNKGKHRGEIKQGNPIEQDSLS